MNINKLLAPRISNRTVLLMLFAYLAMTVLLVIMAAKPFESASGIGFDVGPKSVAATAHPNLGELPAFDFITPTVHAPAPPFIIIE